MDPNANLRAQEAILKQPKLHNYDRYELYDLRCDLRDWLRGGGAGDIPARGGFMIRALDREDPTRDWALIGTTDPQDTKETK